MSRHPSNSTASPLGRAHQPALHAHMAENIAAYGITLKQTEVQLLSTRPQDLCASDPSWYECAGGAGPK